MENPMSTKGRRLGFVLLLTVAGLPSPAAADRGAVTVEVGGSMRLGAVSPSIGAGDSVTGTLAGPCLAVRYALTDRLELGVSAFWDTRAPFVHEPVAVTTASGTSSGALTQDIARWGAALGLRYALVGLVWRIPLGLDVGWAHLSATKRDLLDVSDPRAPTSLGLTLGDGTADHVLLAPSLGLEWLATDHLSFSIMPRLELLLGTGSTVGVVVPLTVGWSWYLL
jgi:hypothetical protein